MYAIVDIAGQQFKVKKNDIVVANRLQGEQGTDIEFEKVLLLSSEDGVTIGAPYVEGAKVTASIVEHKKGDKVIVFKKKKRKRYHVMNGHRQPLTALRINDIVL
jgi:large subunit ribosomal protein L21